MRRIRTLLPLLGVVAAASAFAGPPAFAHGHVSVGIGFGWTGWGGWWYPPPAPGYYGPAYAPTDAAIDTDIHPEEAEVWLDGEYVGIADQFDGFPRYLHVAPGEHRLEFRLEGYRSLVVDLNAVPGRLYGLDRRLREGKGPAEPLPPPDRDRDRGRKAPPERHRATERDRDRDRDHNQGGDDQQPPGENEY